MIISMIKQGVSITREMDAYRQFTEGSSYESFKEAFDEKSLIRAVCKHWLILLDNAEEEKVNVPHLLVNVCEFEAPFWEKLLCHPRLQVAAISLDCCNGIDCQREELVQNAIACAFRSLPNNGATTINIHFPIHSGQSKVDLFSFKQSEEMVMPKKLRLSSSSPCIFQPATMRLSVEELILEKYGTPRILDDYFCKFIMGTFEPSSLQLLHLQHMIVTDFTLLQTVLNAFPNLRTVHFADIVFKLESHLQIKEWTKTLFVSSNLTYLDCRRVTVSPGRLYRFFKCYFTKAQAQTTLLRFGERYEDGDSKLINLKGLEKRISKNAHEASVWTFVAPAIAFLRSQHRSPIRHCIRDLLSIFCQYAGVSCLFGFCWPFVQNSKFSLQQQQQLTSTPQLHLSTASAWREPSTPKAMRKRKTPPSPIIYKLA